MIEWAHEGQMVNQNCYLEVLIELKERGWKKRQELWNKKSWILHQDNVLFHNALAEKQILADKCISNAVTRTYWPDLAPCNFYLFPKVKSALKGTHSQSVD
jgi:hypothetical protein